MKDEKRKCKVCENKNKNSLGDPNRRRYCSDQKSIFDGSWACSRSIILSLCTHDFGILFLTQVTNPHACYDQACFKARPISVGDCNVPTFSFVGYKSLTHRSNGLTSLSLTMRICQRCRVAHQKSYVPLMAHQGW